MPDKEIVYERIHSDFLIRLCEGEFPLGSSMPSLPNLCTQYNVGKNTIIKVMQMLKAEGFIEISQGKVGQVTFDSNNLEQYVKNLPGFVCDKDILFDYYQAMEIIFPTFYTQASLECNEEQLKKIEQIVKAFRDFGTDSKACIYLSIKLSNVIISAIKNQLLKKITEITMRKTMLPCLLLIGHKDVFKDLILQAVEVIEPLFTALQQKNKEQLNICWSKILTTYDMILKKAIVLGVFPNKPSARIVQLFQVMDDEKSFIIAKSFRSQILSGKYRNDDLLPSIEQAKEQYQVSTITVRRAYHILCEMGYTQTVNGKGTQVVSFYKKKHSDCLEKIAAEKKECYCDAVEFLEISLTDIVRAAKDISFLQLRNDIDSQWNVEHQNSVLVVVYHLFKGTGLCAFLTIYEVLDNCLCCGNYIKGIPATEELKEINHQKCLEVIDVLESGNITIATKMLQELFKTLYPKNNPKNNSNVY